MKNLLIVFSAFLLATFACCKKSDSPQYSYWYVNTDSFSTNTATVDRGKAETDIQTNSLENGFGFTFYLDYLPENGTFSITNTIVQYQYYVGIGIHYKNNYYNVLKDLRDSLIATSSNSKAQYILNKTWFKNYSDSTDSILVHGIFNEP